MQTTITMPDHLNKLTDEQIWDDRSTVKVGEQPKPCSHSRLDQYGDCVECGAEYWTCPVCSRVIPRDEQALAKLAEAEREIALAKAYDDDCAADAANSIRQDAADSDRADADRRMDAADGFYDGDEE